MPTYILKSPPGVNTASVLKRGQVAYAWNYPNTHLVEVLSEFYKLPPEIVTGLLDGTIRNRTIGDDVVFEAPEPKAEPDVAPEPDDPPVDLQVTTAPLREKLATPLRRLLGRKS